jgi:hypothetical protein
MLYIISLPCYYHIMGNTQESPAMALHTAVCNGSIQKVKKLLDAKASVNTVYYNSCMPLYYAVSKDNSKMARLLLEHDALVNYQTNCGTTPLMLATQRVNTDCVKVLLDHKADVNICAELDYERNALQTAVLKDSPDIIDLLIKHGADKHIGRRAYDKAVELGKKYAALEVFAPTEEEKLAEAKLAKDRAVERKRFRLAVIQEFYVPRAPVEQKNKECWVVNQPTCMNDTCAVCHAEIDNNAIDEQNITVLSCGHGTHGVCLSTWMAEKLECPMCRTRIGPKPAE